MKRRLVHTLSAISLLLCVATMVLWILSIWVVTRWGYCSERWGTFYVWCGDGCTEVTYEPLLPGTVVTVTGFHAYPAHDSSSFRWGYLGFEVLQKVNEVPLGDVPPLPQIFTNASRPLGFVIPDWFICSITAVLPCLWYRSYRRHRLRKLKGSCLQCGYDLRATPDRCPECGTPIFATESNA